MSGKLVSATMSLHFFFLRFFTFDISLASVLVGVCICMLVSVRFGLLFPAHSEGFPVLHVIVLVWFRVWPTHAFFFLSFASGMGCQKVEFLLSSYFWGKAWATEHRGEGAGKHKKSYRSLIYTDVLAFHLILIWVFCLWLCLMFSVFIYLFSNRFDLSIYMQVCVSFWHVS